MWKNVKYERCNGGSTTTILFLFTLMSGFTNAKIVISRTSCGCLVLKCIRLLVDKVTDVCTICDISKSSRKRNEAIKDMSILRSLSNCSNF